MEPLSHEALTGLLTAMGCPPAKAGEMAAQLDKRARQLGSQKGRTYDEALRHLLTLIQEGWKAQGRTQGDLSPNE